MSKKKIIIFILVIFIIVLASTAFTKYVLPKLHSQKEYTSSEFNIETLKSSHDQDNDEIDDYSDIMQGARSYIETNPKYKSVYYSGGYPDDDYGVCTDVIWQAFESAGYDLKTLVDTDISNNLEQYTNIETPDPNIDFRRVKNLNVFFNRNAQSLTTDFTNPEEWQPGDIVVFTSHIAVCSDKRNSDGIPFIIHHDGLGAREKNDIENYEIVGHFRWSK